jgi:hypothetical protein
VSDTGDAPATGKGRATPKRTQARAARATERKTAPPDRKARAAARRRSMQEAREAMNQTDVAKLPSGERVPELVYTRDVVDSKFYAGQALIWITLVIFLVSLVPALTVITEVAGLIGVVVIIPLTWLDCRRIRRLVLERFPATTIPVRFYAMRRIVSPRRLRKPIPRVARGAQIR